MLIFYCTDCNTTINGDDLETAEQIIGKLDHHIAKCALATFTFEATTDLARQREAGLRAVASSPRRAARAWHELDRENVVG
jgi:hypothetical protein